MKQVTATRLNPHFVVLAVNELEEMIEASEIELIRMVYMYSSLFQDDHAQFTDSCIEDEIDLGESVMSKLCDALAMYLTGQPWPDFEADQTSIREFYTILDACCRNIGWRLKHF